MMDLDPPRREDLTHSVMDDNGKKSWRISIHNFSKSCQKHSSQKISGEDFHALINRMIHLNSIVGLYKDRSASLRSDTSYIMLFWGTSPSVYDPCECVSRAWFWQGSSMLCVYNDRSRIVNNKRVTDQTNMFLPSLSLSRSSICRLVHKHWRDRFVFFIYPIYMKTKHKIDPDTRKPFQACAEAIPTL